MEFNDGLRKISKEIINLPYTEKSESVLRKMFYDIMRKYNIKWGEKDGDGTKGSTPEWIICQTLFINLLETQVYWRFILERTPKDLEY